MRERQVPARNGYAGFPGQVQLIVVIIVDIINNILILSRIDNMLNTSTTCLTATTLITHLAGRHTPRITLCHTIIASARKGCKLFMWVLVKLFTSIHLSDFVHFLCAPKSMLRFYGILT